MQVIVRSRNEAVPPSMRMVVQRKLDRLERIAGDASRADVHFTEERNPRITGRHVCTVTVHLRHGVVTAHAAAAEPVAALDLVLVKLRHQVERAKDRRVSRAHVARRPARRDRTRS
jgi:ribosomal subunit interface protein